MQALLLENLQIAPAFAVLHLLEPLNSDDLCVAAYYRGLELVTSKKEIGKRYLSGWFWLDFVATVPWGAISDMIATPSAFAAQLISLLRLLKLFRLARITPLVTRLTATSTINTGFVNAAKFLFYVLIMAHLLGCMFLVVPLVFPSDSEPWTSVYKIDNMTKDEQCATTVLLF